MKIVFLGVGGGVPSLYRALPAIGAIHDGHILLFDCGEGTQIQLQLANLSLNRITEIYITHNHGDHILGLPGLISSMTLLHRTKPLSIFGPKGLNRLIKLTLEITKVQPEFDLILQEVEEGLVTDNPHYRTECIPALHNIPALSYILRMSDIPGKFDVQKADQLGIIPGPLRKELQQGRPVKTPEGKIVQPTAVVGPSRKGVSFAYSGDTTPNPRFAKAAKGVSLLIHEATFIEEHKAKAAEYFHSTATQAAQIARKAKVGQLALIHISPRYPSGEIHEQEAKAFFPQSFAPNDLDSLILKD